MLVRWLLLSYACLFTQWACSSARSISDSEYAPPLPPVQLQNSQVTGSIYNASNNVYLFEDIKARRIGDSITVILQEKTNASKKASTSSKKSSDISMPDPTLLGRLVTKDGLPILSNTLQSNQDFSGEGDSSQSNSLSGDITVTVVDVLTNGNLIVRGEKILTLNQGSEVVRISGIVRAKDISPNNTILSTQIANAEIAYSGNGMVANSNQPGWLTRFFNSGWWPF